MSKIAYLWEMGIWNNKSAKPCTGTAQLQKAAFGEWVFYFRIGIQIIYKNMPGFCLMFMQQTRNIVLTGHITDEELHLVSSWDIVSRCK